ncbi:MAG: hypothetical protein GC204_19805 [Chloroflexi bacterium]|nr:hypothetical protein [Chloroflexota bacterium]
MQQKPSAFVKPTLDTQYHIDYSWWERNDDLHTYLLSHLPPEQRERLSQNSETSVVDYIDPETGEVSQLNDLDLAIQTATQQPDFINPHTSVVDSIFRVFLANGNQPQTPKQIGDAIGRAPAVILKTVSGGRVYKGIRPVES